MSSLLKWIKKEILEVLPAAIFFWVAFNVINVTEGMMMPKDEIRYTSFLGATVGALIAGKVLLMVDLLPFVDAFRDKPLIYNTLWKTALYALAALLFRVGEHLAPLLLEYKSLVIAYQHFVDEIAWSRFWAIQIWLLVLLLILVASQGLIGAVGPKRVRQIFFGRSRERRRLRRTARSGSHQAVRPLGTPARRS